MFFSLSTTYQERQILQNIKTSSLNQTQWHRGGGFACAEVKKAMCSGLFYNLIKSVLMFSKLEILKVLTHNMSLLSFARLVRILVLIALNKEFVFRNSNVKLRPED